jgi:hypothetical protein
MSHLDKIDLKILDIEAARLAAEELGGTLVKQVTYAWWGSHVGDYPLPAGFAVEDLGKCEYAIKVPGAEWEIGLAKGKGEQHYSLLFDFYGPRGKALEKYLGGRTADKFRQTYTVHAAMNAARKQGYLCQRKTLSNGTQQVIMSV